MLRIKCGSATGSAPVSMACVMVSTRLIVRITVMRKGSTGWGGCMRRLTSRLKGGVAKSNTMAIDANRFWMVAPAWGGVVFSNVVMISGGIVNRVATAANPADRVDLPMTSENQAWNFWFVLCGMN